MKQPPTRIFPLLLAALLFASAPAAAQLTPPDPETDAATPDHPQEMEGVVVHALPGASTDTTVTPVDVLTGTQLDAVKAATLGATVANIPGVQTTALGQAVGRPVIRGMDGPRVAITAGGLGAADASTVSQDHAVAIEPFLADQIEVLKGPATLLYGSGAIGGVINVVDGRIPTEAPLEAISGRAEARWEDVASGSAGAFRLDGGGEHFAWHADGARHHAQDYRIPGGRLPNSGVTTRSGALGGSLVGDWGHVGASVSRYLDRYGSPAEPGDPEEGEDPVHIGLQQTANRIEAGLVEPLPGITRIEAGFGYTDYRHVEYEGSEPETTFTNRSREARVLVTHAELAGWRGTGGVQLLRRDFAALGDESFVPPTRTRAQGFFLTEQRNFGPLQLELGARRDRERVTPRALPARDFHPVSLAAGLAWQASAAWRWTLNLDRAQRAPADEELFADGPHEASATWEIGDPDLRVETARQAELGVHLRSRLVDAKLAVWQNNFRGFIHLADTGAFADGLPVREWRQSDARFRGLEGEAALHLRQGPGGHFDLRLHGDHVRARRRDGANLPRIPVARLGTDLVWERDAWRVSLGATRWFAQRHRAEHETPTPGFTRIDLHASWTVHDGYASQWQLFLDGENLGNQTMRLATSLFKDASPLPGRALSLGVRAWF